MSNETKLLTYALDAALEIHPECFSISGNEGLAYEGEPIPDEVVALLEPNDLDHMLDSLIEKALSLKKFQTQKVTAS